MDSKVRFVAAQAYLAHLSSRLPQNFLTPSDLAASLRAARYDPEELRLRRLKRELFEEEEEEGDDNDDDNDNDDADNDDDDDNDDEEEDGGETQEYEEDEVDEDGIVIGRRGGGEGSGAGSVGGGGVGLNTLLGNNEHFADEKTEEEARNQKRTGGRSPQSLGRQEEWVGGADTNPMVKLHAMGLCVAGSSGHNKAKPKNQKGVDSLFELRSEHEAIVNALPKAAIASAAEDVARLLTQVISNDYGDDDGNKKEQQPPPTKRGSTAAGAGIVELWLLDYVDALARWALGLPGYGADARALKRRRQSLTLDELNRQPSLKKKPVNTDTTDANAVSFSSSSSSSSSNTRQPTSAAAATVSRKKKRGQRARARDVRAEVLDLGLDRVEALGEFADKCLGLLQRLPPEAFASKTLWEKGPEVLFVEPSAADGAE